MRNTSTLVLLGLAVGCGSGTVTAPNTAPVDSDGDGYASNVDCDDSVATGANVHPGLAEVCGDGVDQDCSGGDLACPACGAAVACAPQAQCILVAGMPTCVCADGLSGNGWVCYRQLAPSVAPLCGNGTVEEDEQCDDGSHAPGDGCSATCEVELDTVEIHPVLLVREAERVALAAKLGTSSSRGTVGVALTAWLHGERSQASIDFIRTALLPGANGIDIYTALLVYDVQHEYMTTDERTEFRTAFLADAQSVYEQVVAVSAWYFIRRMVNNWTYRHAGAPLPRMLLSGLMFRTDPAADAYVREGLKLVRWLFEADSSNGVWDRDAQAFAQWPTQSDINDEILATPGSYGLWAAANLSELHYIVYHATGFDPYAHLDRAVYSWGRYWTYVLTFDEGISWSEWGDYSLASYAGQTGHGNFGHINYYSNAYMLHYAHRYGDPVFAWHYYANPSCIRFDGTYEATWNTPLTSYESWLQFLDWGAVAPTPPQEAGWPLSAYWPNAGVGVIRKSWEKKGPGSGVIWLRSGPGGSHDRPTYGGVQYHADSAVLLGAGPSTYTYDFLTRDPHVNNTLFIDDQGERGYYAQNAEIDRLRHGHTEWLDADTFLMDMSPQTAIDTMSPFDDLAYDVFWTRKVHYDRAADILWIKDVATTSDGTSHQFRANWVSDATVRAADVYDLPAGYVMVADASAPVVAEERVYDGTAPEYVFKAIFAGADGPAVRLWWAIGKNEQAARAMLAANRGVFVSQVTHGRDGAGRVVVTFATDEPSQARVEFGATAALGQSATDASPVRIHVLTLPSTDGQRVYYRIVAPDAQGDETVMTSAGVPFEVAP